MLNTSNLIQRAQNDDREAFGELYAEYYSLVRWKVSQIVRHDDIEDVTQKAFLKAMLALPQYTYTTVENFKGWLVRIAANAAIDHKRNFWHRVNALELIVGDDEPVISSNTENDHIRRATVYEALEALPQSQREALVLRYVVGLSPIEIADKLGRTKMAVNLVLHRGRRNMQSKLQAVA